MTIEQLADATGMTKGHLSRVERDQTSPSVASLVTLCEVLSLDVGTLFREPDAKLVRGGDAPKINLGGSFVEEVLVSPRTESRAQVIRSVVRAGTVGSGGDALYAVNAPLEVVHLIAGRIEFVLGSSRHVLEPGDTLTLDGREPHTWRTLDEAGAEIMWFLVPAAWNGTS